jgi:hypothetical protein
MTTPDEYRHFAEECLRWARDAETDEERKAFLDMARTWTKAAAQASGEAVPDIRAKSHATSTRMPVMSHGGR